MEVERARDAEKVLLGQLKLALVRQWELETVHFITADIKGEESTSVAAWLASKLNGLAV